MVTANGPAMALAMDLANGLAMDLANGLALDSQARITRTNGGMNRPPHP